MAENNVESVKALRNEIAGEINSFYNFIPFLKFRWKVVFLDEKGEEFLNGNLSYLAKSVTLPNYSLNKVANNLAGTDYTIVTIDKSSQILEVTFYENEDLDVHNFANICLFSKSKSKDGYVQRYNPIPREITIRIEIEELGTKASAMDKKIDEALDKIDADTEGPGDGIFDTYKNLFNNWKTGVTSYVDALTSGTTPEEEKEAKNGWLRTEVYKCQLSSFEGGQLTSDSPMVEELKLTFIVNDVEQAYIPKGSFKNTANSNKVTDHSGAGKTFKRPKAPEPAPVVGKSPFSTEGISQETIDKYRKELYDTSKGAAIYKDGYLDQIREDLKIPAGADAVQIAKHLEALGIISQKPKSLCARFDTLRDQLADEKAHKYESLNARDYMQGANKAAAKQLESQGYNLATAKMYTKKDIADALGKDVSTVSKADIDTFLKNRTDYGDKVILHSAKNDEYNKTHSNKLSSQHKMTVGEKGETHSDYNTAGHGQGTFTGIGADSLKTDDWKFYVIQNDAARAKRNATKG